MNERLARPDNQQRIAGTLARRRKGRLFVLAAGGLSWGRALVQLDDDAADAPDAGPLVGAERLDLRVRARGLPEGAVSELDFGA